MTQEILTDEFHTCKTCGIHDGEDFYNWVICSECRKCKKKREDEFDFKRAQRDKYANRDNDIMCCKCGYVDDEECYDYNELDEWTCPRCETKQSLEVSFTTHYRTAL